MNKDQVFNQDFIELVKSHPCLYNFNLHEYKIASSQENAWGTVAKNASDTVENVRKRWRNLRCSMTRYLKSTRNSSTGNGSMPKKYYLADAMQFMIPFLKLKEDNCLRSYISENLSFTEDSNEIVMKIVDPLCIKAGREFHTDNKSNELTSDDEEKHEVYEIEALDDEIEQQNNHHQINEQTLDANQLDSNRQQNQQTLSLQEYDLDPFSSHLVQSPPMKKFKITEVGSPPAAVTMAQTSVQDDADLSFLKSLVPDIQQMNAQQKRKFKLTVLNLIDELLSASEKS